MVTLRRDVGGLLYIIRFNDMIIHGRNLIVKIGNVAIAAAKSCDLQVDCEEIEVASPDTGAWRQYVAGRKSWQVNTGHLVTAVATNAAKVGTIVTLTFQVGSTTDTLTGSALVRSWKVSGAVGNLAQGSFQFLGSGALS